MAGTTIGESDAGKTFQLHVGQSLVLRLPENPTTGYRWELERHDAAVVDVGEGTFTRDGDAIGSGGAAQWVLTARAPGSTSVALKRWRQWEGEHSVKGRFAVTLKIER